MGSYEPIQPPPDQPSPQGLGARDKIQIFLASTVWTLLVLAGVVPDYQSTPIGLDKSGLPILIAGALLVVDFYICPSMLVYSRREYSMGRLLGFAFVLLVLIWLVSQWEPIATGLWLLLFGVVFAFFKVFMSFGYCNTLCLQRTGPENQ